MKPTEFIDLFGTIESVTDADPTAVLDWVGGLTVPVVDVDRVGAWPSCQFSY